MRSASVCILIILLISHFSESEILSRNVKDTKTTLMDQFNNYVDQTIDMINNKQSALSTLPFYFTKGKWGYLLLNIDYSLKLFNGSVTGISKLHRSGDAFVGYNKTTGNLTISLTVTSQQVQASYAAEVKVYGLSHQGQVISTVPGLNISVDLSVSSANLRVSLDRIRVATTQAPDVTFISSNPVLSYFAPLVTNLGAMTNLTVAAVAQSSILTTIDELNSPSFGYY